MDAILMILYAQFFVFLLAAVVPCFFRTPDQRLEHPAGSEHAAARRSALISRLTA